MASVGEKRTPMAWQHRDMNYHSGVYQERYGQGYELNGMRTGPPSTSDRLSHRTDKSWRTQRDSQAAYPPSRPSYSTGRPPSHHHSVTTSTTSTSSSESDTENEDIRGPPQPIYGYEGYPGYAPRQIPGYPPSISQYPGTLKSAKSVPALGTWNGEPCPVHGIGPLSLPGPQPPPVMIPPQAFTLPSKKANSLYDMRMVVPYPHPPPPPPSVGAIYSTLPIRPPGVERRNVVGGPVGIPPQFLPPMARPRPLVLSEEGTTEPLPVRSPPDKANTLPLEVANKIANSNKDDKQKEKCRGGLCVGMIVMGVICTGLLLGILLVFIL